MEWDFIDPCEEMLSFPREVRGQAQLKSNVDEFIVLEGLEMC